MRKRRSVPTAVSATAPDLPPHWYERDPERRAWELGEFARRGLPSSELLCDGDLTVKTGMSYEGADLEIYVHYPYEYPDFPPTVYGPPGQ